MIKSISKFFEKRQKEAERREYVDARDTGFELLEAIGYNKKQIDEGMTWAIKMTLHTPGFHGIGKAFLLEQYVLFWARTQESVSMQDFNRLLDRGIPALGLISTMTKEDIAKIGKTKEGAKRILDEMYDNQVNRKRVVK